MRTLHYQIWAVFDKAFSLPRAPRLKRKAAVRVKASRAFLLNDRDLVHLPDAEVCQSGISVSVKPLATHVFTSLWAP